MAEAGPSQEQQQGGNAVTNYFSSAKSAPEWPYILTDLILKGSNAIFYFFCTWFTSNFIINFVTATVLIVVDFWFTKNIGGRRLVGMRWWHVPSTDGTEGTTWRFEHRGIFEPQYKPSKIASTQFWGSLIIMELFWALMAIFTIQSPGYLILCGMGFTFVFTNINGYWKCRNWAIHQLPQSQQEGLNVPSVPGIPSGTANVFLQGAANVI